MSLQSAILKEVLPKEKTANDKKQKEKSLCDIRPLSTKDQTNFTPLF